jgi:hypothetical protein
VTNVIYDSNNLNFEDNLPVCPGGLSLMLSVGNEVLFSSPLLGARESWPDIDYQRAPPELDRGSTVRIDVECYLTEDAEPLTGYYEDTVLYPIKHEFGAYLWVQGEQESSTDCLDLGIDSHIICIRTNIFREINWGSYGP